MTKKILIAVCCLAIAFVAGSRWVAYRNQQKFEAVLAEYAKTPTAHR